MTSAANSNFVKPDPKKPNLVIFAGAGLSVGAGLPTMLSFSHAVRTCSTLPVQDKCEFERIQIACSPYTALTGASSRNLEDLASFLSVMDLSQPDFKFAGCAANTTPRTALALLLKCIGHVTAPTNHQYEANAGRVVEATAPHANITVVTTNYDLNVELSAAALGVTTQMLDWIDASTTTKSTGGPQEGVESLYRNTFARDTGGAAWYLRLFKLHGSMNWRQAGSIVRVEDRMRLVDSAHRSRPSSYRMENLALDPNDGESQLLVIPAIVKAEGLGALANEWKGASAAIADADAIWFIGYSFPQSDGFMRHFLAGAIHANARLRQIVVLDPNALEIQARVHELFGSPELKGLVESIPLKWERFVGNFQSLLQRTWVPDLSSQPELKELRNQIEGRVVLEGGLVRSEDVRPRPLRGRCRW